MTSSVLWYVHDHGDGHLQRCLAVLPHLEANVVVASSRCDLAARVPRSLATTSTLPSDVIAGAGAQGPWHYAPTGAVTTGRAGALIDALRAYACTTAVVDVSVETAVLCRLAGLRVITLRQSGRREDDAHRIGFSSADAVWVPQHPELEPIDAASRSLPLRWSGGFSRFDAEPTTRSAARVALGIEPEERLMVMVIGRGGNRFPSTEWQVDCGPARTRVAILGLEEAWQTDSSTSFGRVENPFTWLVASDGVVTSGGWASVHDTVAAGTRLAIVAEPRPFDEQAVRADELHRRGLAVALDEWPTPDRVDGLLDVLLENDPDSWSEFYDHQGAQRAAALIDQVHHDG